MLLIYHLQGSHYRNFNLPRIREIYTELIEMCQTFNVNRKAKTAINMTNEVLNCLERVGVERTSFLDLKYSIVPHAP